MILRNELLHFHPEFRRCLTRFFFKDAGKIGFFIVANFKADIGDRFFGVDQQVLRLDEFPEFYDFSNTSLQNIMADEVKIPGRHT